MIIKKIFGSILLTYVFVLSSCSVEKRQYTSGYFIDWNNRKINTQTRSDVKPEKIGENKIENNTGNKKIESASVDTVSVVNVNRKEVSVRSKKNVEAIERPTSVPTETKKNPDQLEKPAFRRPQDDRDDPSKNWAAIVGFIFAFLNPILGIIFCVIGLKSEYRTLAIVGLGISIFFLLIAFVLFILLLAILSTQHGK